MSHIYQPFLVATGSNANGSYWRYADGRQTCEVMITATTQDWTTAYGAFFGPSAEQTWTFPIAFSAEPAVIGNIGRQGALTPSFLTIRACNTTTANYFPGTYTSLNTASSKLVIMSAHGRWF